MDINEFYSSFKSHLVALNTNVIICVQICLNNIFNIILDFVIILIY